MDEEQITNLFFSDPDKLFKIIWDEGGNLDEIKKLKLGKLIAKQRFPELINLDREEAVEFVFWFTYYIEREIRNDIFFIETHLGKLSEQTGAMVDEMNFGQKINFIKSHYVKDPQVDNYVKVFKDIKDLRNFMAHGELDKLMYGGFYLSDPRGQLKLFANLRNGALKRDLVN
jgi:hypothetical protein